MSSLTAETITIAGAGGDEIEAYLARPQGPQRRGGMVVIHHIPGYDRATKEIVRRFAELGCDAVCPNLFHREAPGADADDAAAVDCYGGYVVRDSPDDARTSLVPKLPDLSCSLLGLFGKDDQRPSPPEVEQLATLLRQHGKQFEFHSYDGAGHAFFASTVPRTASRRLSTAG